MDLLDWLLGVMMICASLAFLSLAIYISFGVLASLGLI